MTKRAKAWYTLAELEAVQGRTREGLSLDRREHTRQHKAARTDVEALLPMARFGGKVREIIRTIDIELGASGLCAVHVPRLRPLIEQLRALALVDVEAEETT